jgi:hypothetical protein
VLFVEASALSVEANAPSVEAFALPVQANRPSARTGGVDVGTNLAANGWIVQETGRRDFGGYFPNTFW